MANEEMRMFGYVCPKCGKAVLAARGNGMQMETLPGEAADISGGSYYVIWPETTANLINESFNPYQTPVSKDDIYSPWY